MNYNLAGFFSGVGGIELGFQQAGFNPVWSNEFNPKSCQTFRENHEHTLVEGDVYNIPMEEIPNMDIIVGGLPCQAFSIAGEGLGFKDERGVLFFKYLDIIKEKSPEVVFIENVPNLLNHDGGRTYKIMKSLLEKEGYFVTQDVLASDEYGNVRQGRDRIYIIGFKDEEVFNRFSFPDKIPLTSNVEDFVDLENKVEDKYYYTYEKFKHYALLEESVTKEKVFYQWRRKYVRENKSGVCPTLTANMGTGGHNVPIIKTAHGLRKLTPRECFNLQGFNEDFVLPDLANCHLYEQAGNSVVVPVIKRIAEKIKEALEGK